MAPLRAKGHTGVATCFKHFVAFLNFGKEWAHGTVFVTVSVRVDLVALTSLCCHMNQLLHAASVGLLKRYLKGLAGNTLVFKLSCPLCHDPTYPLHSLNHTCIKMRAKVTKDVVWAMLGMKEQFSGC